MGRAQGERQGEEEWLFEEGEANTGLMCLQGEGVEVWKDPHPNQHAANNGTSGKRSFFVT